MKKHVFEIGIATDEPIEAVAEAVRGLIGVPLRRRSATLYADPYAGWPGAVHTVYLYADDGSGSAATEDRSYPSRYIFRVEDARARADDYAARLSRRINGNCTVLPGVDD